MDDDQSINDILTEISDDDHENWSDFSIEEELPSNYREEERNNNKSKLCQVEWKSKATAAQDTLETIEMETENLVKSILEELLDKVFDSNEQSDDVDEEIRILPEIAQETCHCPKGCNDDAFEVEEVNHDLNNNLIIEDFANALASEVIHEMLNDAKDLQEMEDEDEFFLVLHPPTHEESGIKSFSFVPFSSRIFFTRQKIKAEFEFSRQKLKYN